MSNQIKPNAITPELLGEHSESVGTLPDTYANMEISNIFITEASQNESVLRNTLRACMQEIAETSPEVLDKIKTIKTTQTMHIIVGSPQIEITLK